MSPKYTLTTRLLSAALSASLALLSITALTDTAHAKADPRAECAPTGGFSLRSSHSAPFCAGTVEISLAASRALVRE
jgi:hypothetical protein